MLGKRKKGQGLVEFALILPILLLVLLGIIEAAWVIWAYISVQNVARETARYAVTGQPLNDDGSPWTLTAEERAKAIFATGQEFARASNLPVDGWPGIDDPVSPKTGAQRLADYSSTSNIGRPRMFGILFRGQTSPSDSEGTPYHPGLRGLNINVQTYYNVNMLDPLYDTIMGGRSIHLQGNVTLQNEGLNLALGGELPEFAPPNASNQGSGGAQGNSPQLAVYYQGSPITSVPAGELIDLQLSQHDFTKTYYVCLDGVSIGASGNPVTTNSSGNANISNYAIPLTVSPGSHTFTSHLNDPGCGSGTQAAQTSVDVTIPVGPIITVSDIAGGNHTDYTWPDNSLVLVKVFAHDQNKTYTVKFNGVNMPVGDGTSTLCQITTDLQRSGSAICAVPNGLSAGGYLVTSSYATGTVQVKTASLTVQGSSTRFDNSTIRVNVRDHAPNTQYYMYLGSTSRKAFTTNAQGAAVIDMYIPKNLTGVQRVHTFDVDETQTKYGVPTSLVREIADTNITVQLNTAPFIDLVGAPQRSAGDVVDMYLRNHTPNTNYSVWLAVDTSSGSPIGTAQTISTGTTGDSVRFPYQIPNTATAGNRMFISYLAGQSTVYSATQTIQILPKARLVIKDGDKHFPEEKITIYVLDHTPNTAYDIYIDLNGDGVLSDTTEKIAANVVTDSIGNAEISYKLPKSADLGSNLTVPRKVASKQWDEDANDTGDPEVATTQLIIVEADLMVTKITFPANPQPGLDMPVQVSVTNSSTITLTNFAFDNDLYVDPAPASPPSASQVLPPGEAKIWIDQIGPQQTLVITPVINVYNRGTYSVYGRTDTSNKVVESREDNNITPATLVIACTLTPQSDDFANGIIDSPWQPIKYFGNGGGGVLSFYWQPAPSKALVLPAAAYSSGSAAQPPALAVPRSTVQPNTITQNPAAVAAQPAVMQANAAAVPNLQSVVLDIPIGASSDDAEETRNSWWFFNGFLSTNSTTLDFDSTHYVGLRFTGVNLQAGDTIESAYIEFTTAANDNTNTSMLIRGQKSLSPGTFSGNWDISTRLSSSATSNSVNWNPVPNWSGNRTFQTPDISAIVTEIISQANWNSSSKAMVFLIDANGQRRAQTYDNGSGIPILHIQYRRGGNTPTPTPTPTRTPTPTNTPTSTPTNTTTPVPTNTPTPLPPATPVPPASFTPPNPLTATLVAGQSDQINLTWKDNSGNEGSGAEEDGFIIWRSVAGGSWVQIATVGRDVTSYTDAAAICGGQLHSYRVQGFRTPDVLSDFSNTSNATTGNCPVSTCTGSREQSGSLTLCSAGSSITQASDANGGYGFIYRPVNSFAFDMVIRLMSVPTQTAQALAGLEVRDSVASNTANKVQLVMRNQDKTVRVFTRGSVSPTGSWQSTGGTPNASLQIPTWLRIVRANGSFYFYYNAVDTEVPVYGAWELLGSTTDVLGQNVSVGMINATGTNNLLGQSVWTNFRLSCPLEQVGAAVSCGAVDEQTGQAVVNAVNYVDKYPSSNTSTTYDWLNKTRTVSGVSLPAVYVPDAGNSFDQTNFPNAPMLEYAVNIAQPGNYFIWVYGYSPNDSGDTIQVGLNGKRLDFGTMEDQASGSGLRWFTTNLSGRPTQAYLEQGVHILNFWEAEDGFELIQVLLTNRPSFTPQSQFYNQSACLAPVPAELPAKLEQCTNVLQNAGFKDSDGVGFALNWKTGPLGNRATYSSFPSNGDDSFGMGFFSFNESGTARNNPYLSQQFTFPNWLNNGTSTAKLSLDKAVDRRGASTAADKLYMVLRDETGQNLTTPLVLGTGADLPDVGGGFPAFSDFRAFPADSSQQNNLFASGVALDSNIERLAGKSAVAYFYMPNSPSDPNYPASTDFYIDTLKLQVCTAQPVPIAQSGRGIIQGQIKIAVNQTEQAVAGATVWLLQLDPPGPVQVTYSIAGTTSGTPLGYYSFYNVTPGATYVLYSEFYNTDGTPFGVSESNVTVSANQTVNRNLILRKDLLGGGSTLFN